MIKTAMGRVPDDAEWAAFEARHPADYLYGVSTTGVVCRHGCAARTPLRKNVRLFGSVVEAINAGFRPCKRCQPTD